jgi:hypothetical protein
MADDGAVAGIGAGSSATADDDAANVAAAAKMQADRTRRRFFISVLDL